MRENERLAVLVRDGDTGALDPLWQNVRRFVYGFVRRYKETQTVDFDDLMQSAFIGVYEAAQRYDPDKGAFLTIAEWYIRKACRDTLDIRTNTAQIVCVSLNKPLGDDQDGATLEELLKDENIAPFDEGITTEELRRDVCGAVARLSDQDRKVIQMRYFDGQSLQQTADALNMNMGQVTRVQTRALRSLRRNPVIASYASEYERSAECGWTGTGLSAYRNTGLSSVERAVIG